MSTEPFIGEVKIFAFNFAPRGHMLCAGQILSIASNSALFSLLGTTYGGNGTTTFALPNLQGRMPIGQGSGAGLPTHTMGEVAGTPTTTLTTANMPAHNHLGAGITVNVPISTGGADTSSPSGAFLADTGAEVFSSVASPNSYYGHLQVGGTTSITGSNMPFSIMNPYLVMNYSIAIYGIFPSRD